MDKTIQFQRIVRVLKSGCKSIQDISKISGMMLDEVVETLVYAAVTNLKQYWCIEFYNDGLDINIDINDEITKNEDKEYNMRLLKEYLCPETMVSFRSNMFSLEDEKFLTQIERWTLFDVFKECGGTFAAEERKAIINSLHSELNDKYMAVSEKRIIKRYMDIFNFNDVVLLKLYEAINKRCSINVWLKEGIALKNILPSRVYLDDDQNRWYLEHIREGEPFTIWLKMIVEVDLLSSMNAEAAVESLPESRREMHRIKIRVYDEKNSRERAVGFLSAKYIIEEKISYGYTDITAKVMNLEAFKKWVMEMTPQVIILEPEKLKLEFINMANSWIRNYSAGI